MRNLKAYVWTGLALVLVVGLIFSMFAPHGADLERKPGNAIRESYLNPEGEGIVLPAEETGLQLSAEPNAWTFNVTEAGSYYINVGYLPLGDDGRELDMIFLLDGSVVTVAVVFAFFAAVLAVSSTVSAFFSNPTRRNIRWYIL